MRVAARELGYRPNAAARALRSGTASAVGLVVSDVTHPFFGSPCAARSEPLPGGPRRRADRRQLRRRLGRQLGRAAARGRVDGFLFFAADPPPSLRRPGAPPIVLVESERPRLPSVRLDVEAGLELLFDHLVELGHRRIGYVRSAIEGQTFQRRHGRWAARLQGIGEDPADQVVASSIFDAEAAIAAGHQVLDQLDRLTAVVCDDDFLASGVLAAAAERGVGSPSSCRCAASTTSPCRAWSPRR